MNNDGLKLLHQDLAASPPGEAMRLGIVGNSPEDVSLRWERWNELADYERQLQKQEEEAGSDRGDRIYGLADVGDAYGDLDRLKSSPTLVWQMENHIGQGRNEVDDGVLERVVEDAIADARNPNRTERVPARGDASRWWEDEHDTYVGSGESNGSPMDLLEADETVMLLRRRIIDALVHAQEMARQPQQRAEAERYVKQEMTAANEHVEVAARKYLSAARGFRETLRDEHVPESVHEVFEVNERVAASRGAAMIAYSAALHQGAQRTAPFMAGVRRSLSERFPHQVNDIMASKAGRLAEKSSVESALRLTPKNPATWYPDVDKTGDQVREYVEASFERDQLDWDEMTARRHVPRTATLRGQGLGMACYDVMSSEQKEVSDRWRRLSNVERESLDDGGVNSRIAHEYSRMIGIPEMPALGLEDRSKIPSESLRVQKSMIERTHTPESVYSVEPPTVTTVTETTVEREG
ncbi:hypothetical protein BI49514_02386 [Brevibacterium iodinum ATCC 49514]|uniref:Uncharacterized protein n=1 Tax=Brevibacterium iodinum ATCC 49514 TaxID=1255616 RepID=A0A2H1JVG5_9MICO|nr:hypothetical protein [Brevibacterium iodinum]SMX91304.1 hypothetical protein BI49514_02386 [Brevibacterium iodinum ATCC 49514]SUW70180.1 Uncharacterised protein [Brevibacterium iodinum]